MANGISEKRRTIDLLLGIFFGWCGFHKSYEGKTLIWVVIYLCTAGLFGIGLIIDLVKIIMGKATDANGDLILNW